MGFISEAKFGTSDGAALASPHLWLRWREAAVIGRWKPMLAQCLPVVAPEQQVFKTDPHLHKHMHVHMHMHAH